MVKNNVSPPLESLVKQELQKQKTWSKQLPMIYYFRSVTGKEVDFIITQSCYYICYIEKSVINNQILL